MYIRTCIVDKLRPKWVIDIDRDVLNAQLKWKGEKCVLSWNERGSRDSYFFFILFPHTQCSGVLRTMYGLLWVFPDDHWSSQRLLWLLLFRLTTDRPTQLRAFLRPDFFLLFLHFLWRNEGPDKANTFFIGATANINWIFLTADLGRFCVLYVPSGGLAIVALIRRLIMHARN